MNNMQVFNFEDKEVRTVLINEEPHWVLKDICDVLGLTTTSRVSERLEEDEVSSTHVIDSLGRKQETTIVNESGLYTVILRSDKPKAKEFRKWVTSEVLPAIRRTGSYSMPKTPMEVMKLMFEATEDIDRRVTNIEQNSAITPSEYNLINTKVSERIRTIKRERKLNLDRKQNSVMFRALNGEVKVVTGVRTRAQIRTKDLEKVLDFIRDWEPSKSTMYLIDNEKENRNA